MVIYQFKSYREFLAYYVRTHRYKGLISKLAAEAGCDRTYFSQVLSGKAELTPDHAVKLSEFFSFNDSESEYFLTLLLRDRSAQAKAKQIFETKMKRLRSEAQELSKRVKQKNNTDELNFKNKVLYYSSWYYPVVHTLTSIREFQTLSALAKKVNSTESQIHSTLMQLIEMNLVKDMGDRYVHNGNSIYLLREDPQVGNFHLQSRLEAVKRSFEKQDIHFTNLFSISAQDLEAFKTMVLKFLEDHRKAVSDSGAEVACVLNCDFFCI